MTTPPTLVLIPIMIPDITLPLISAPKLSIIDRKGLSSELPAQRYLSFLKR
jgi:hypothetical protein